MVTVSVRSCGRQPTGTGSHPSWPARDVTVIMRHRVAASRVRWVMSRDQSIAGLVDRARQLHASLRDERRQQLIQQAHDVLIPAQFVRPLLFDGLYAVVLDVSGDDPGEG